MMNAVKIALDSLEELRSIIANSDYRETESLEEQIQKTKRIFVAAAGRSLLAIKFFAMRLMQLGFTTYVVGEVCTPSIQAGDLLIVGSGSGETPGMVAIARKAKTIGASIALLTKSPSSTLAREADIVVHLNSTVPIREGAATPQGWDMNVYTTIRPSGNPFEQSIVIMSDAIICSLMVKLQRGTGYIAGNHANLE